MKIIQFDLDISNLGTEIGRTSFEVIDIFALIG